MMLDAPAHIHDLLAWGGLWLVVAGVAFWLHELRRCRERRRDDHQHPAAPEW